MSERKPKKKLHKVVEVKTIQEWTVGPSRGVGRLMYCVKLDCGHSRKFPVSGRGGPPGKAACSARVWGATKDADQKTHPCLVPYAELPEAQRRKDALYIAVVRAMHAALS